MKTKGKKEFGETMTDEGLNIKQKDQK